MHGTLYRRLYERLADLIPLAGNLTEGASFYSPPRLEGDIASYCSISSVHGPVCKLEISQDALKFGVLRPALSLAFRVDVAQQTAELLTVEDQWCFEVVHTDHHAPNPRRSKMNVFAVNTLAAMLNLGGVFRRLDLPAKVEARGERV